MAQTIKHVKVSAVPDGSDTAQVQPSDWNANHAIIGTVDYSEISGKPAPASTTEVLAGTDATKAVTPDALAALWEKGTDVGAAATLVLGEGGFFNVTGTAAISMMTFGPAKTGRIVWLTFISAGSTLVPGSGLSLPGGATITTQPFDRACFVYYNPGSVICLAYTRADGKPIAGGASVTISDTAPVAPDPGALWWESDTGKLFIYYNDGNTSQWVEAQASGLIPPAASIPFTPVGNIAATTVQAAIEEVAAEPKGWRNRIINGDFRIDQRVNAGGISIPGPGFNYPLDRWRVYAGQAPGLVNAGVANDFGGVLGENAMYVQAGVVDASLAANDFYFVGQLIEGYFCRDFNWGNSSAKPITISFVAYSTVAATLPISVRNVSNTRVWLGSFTVPVTTNTPVSITIPGDTTGTWEKTNLKGVEIEIGLGIGSTYQGVAGWQEGTVLTLPGMTNFMATAGNTLYISKFQVELGSVATEFERVPFDEQLRRCMRYYQKTFPLGFVPGDNVSPSGAIYCATQAVTGYYGEKWEFPVRMRAPPTVATYSPAGGTAGWWRDGANATSSQPLSSAMENGVYIYMNNATSMAWTASVYNIQATASAEL